ncbi:cytochrome C [Geomonas paludis]|uniref:Cytochrome C n=1 Tax=Geomonas paludis TaxID=2740185 RepID=A0A6V8MX26_9BACT|nr:cytochrome C [Geomonas paludis]UPU37144.1 cytochrome C [Geomonas paludis]GFO64758.1 cytochrome c [Geomonas paludis]
MKKQKVKGGLAAASAAASLVLVAGVSFAAHPPVTLYTFEEIGYQMNNGQKVPVQVDATGKGMPYSPKQTCGTSGCHTSKNGIDLSYDHISDHSFHSAQGRNEFPDTANGKFDPTKNKPWTQATAMVGKW